MKCYKCGKEMSCVGDSGWRKHKDGEKERYAEYMCTECRTWIMYKVSDCSECDFEDE